MRITRWALAVVVLAVLALLAACTEDSKRTDTDGDDVVDGDIPDGEADGDTDDPADGDSPDGDLDPDGEDNTEEYDDETFRGDILIPRGAGVSLTPTSYDQNGEPGDGSWRTVDNYLTDLIASNFAYTAEGLVLGYGPLSRQVKVATYAAELPADNGALLALVKGPYPSTTIIPIESGVYIYLYMEDGDTTYYMRLRYAYKTGAGLHGEYAFSTSPKFP